jgi:hypothetical protein
MILSPVYITPVFIVSAVLDFKHASERLFQLKTIPAPTPSVSIALLAGIQLSIP